MLNRRPLTGDNHRSFSDPLAWVQDYFSRMGWSPFPFQRQTWQAYLAGGSGLVHAATGTGKTYAVWLGPILEWLMQNPDPARWQPKQPPSLRVLWVTPLRALAIDTANALQAPLTAWGLPWTLQTRTSDTAGSIRTRQRKRLPTALVTTPESLSLLLSWPDAAGLFADLQAVIVDEWHELLSSKRGVQVELALARLRSWRPSLRVWGMSATLGNVAEAAEVLLPTDVPRHVIAGEQPKPVVIDSLIPATMERFPWAGHLGLRLLPEVVAAIESARSALVFTNTRAQAETWYQAILAERPEWAGLMALHHGSLDRRVREFVEDGLRAGRWRCVVCTSSLDLGVDFSPVDRVLQIGSAKGVSRLLQRAGRSGHQPGATSRVTVVPTNAWELLEVAAARDAAAAGQLEGRPPLLAPMDVLVQHLVTVALGGGFRPDSLLAEVRSTFAYRHLTEAQWQWALNFVTCGGETLRAYPEFSRVAPDEAGVYRVTNPATARRHRTSIGTIVADASVQVRLLRGGKLGTVEESFIAKLKPGDRFTFAGRTLELVRVFEMTAWVRASKRTGAIPRWVGGRMPLSSELAQAVRAKLDAARRGLGHGPEMEALRPILQLQAQRSAIPARDQLLIEQLRSREGHHLFVYPFAGRGVHEGLAALLALRLARREPNTFTFAVNDYGLELLASRPVPIEAALAEGLFSPQGLSEDLQASLNAGELARRQFREIARVAGLVHPGMPGSHKSAKQLQASSGLFFDVFREYDPTHPLLAQAMREVCDRQLEEGRLRALLEDLAQGQWIIRPLQRPTPLAFPLMVERLRDQLSSEKLADRIRRMQLE
jgi:ATP-dependent Lhr-like helicase